jgi:hypothetical protein
MNDPKIIELNKIYNTFTFITGDSFAQVLEDFERKLRFENRFFNENHPVFDHIKKLFDDHTITLTQNELLYRARRIELKKANESDMENYFYGFSKKDSFVPPAKKVPENRANSKGIPCLYTSKDDITAIAEVRPFIGNDISVATIRPLRDLKLLDLFINPHLPHDEIFKQPSYSIWFGIALPFSIPYECTSENEYLLTQCISEYIQLSGFDGIQYSSSLSEGGKNIALFNCKHEDDGGKYDICEPICSHICTVKRIEHNFEFYN